MEERSKITILHTDRCYSVHWQCRQNMWSKHTYVESHNVYSWMKTNYNLSTIHVVSSGYKSMFANVTGWEWVLSSKGHLSIQLIINISWQSLSHMISISHKHKVLLLYNHNSNCFICLSCNWNSASSILKVAFRGG